MTKEERIESYKKYMSLVNRDGKEELFNWLRNTDFFTAPASTRFHNNHEGGLFDHSVNVLEYARNLYTFSKKNYDFPDLNPESIILCALHHDLCKINFYFKDKLWTKANDVWIDYVGYKIIDEFPLGHGEKSLVYLLQHMKLTNDEMLAIRHHMGKYGAEEIAVENALTNPLVYLIYISDICSGLVEKTTDYKQIAIDKRPIR